MEGLGAHYAVTLHRAELRQAATRVHTTRATSAPSLSLPWRLAVAHVKQATSYIRRSVAALRQAQPEPDQADQAGSIMRRVSAG